MKNNIVVTEVFILFLIMAVGFYARRKRILNDEITQGLSELLLTITMPLLTLASFHFNFSKEMLINAGLIVICSIVLHIFAFFSGKVLYLKYPDKIRKVLIFTAVFCNCGFMGYPILESLFGKTGIFYGSMYSAVYNFFVWTVGVKIFTGKNDPGSFKKALANPGLIAVFLGLILFIFSIKLPFPIYRALDLVGSMTTPISMLIIGSTLAESNFSKLFSNIPIFYGTLVRLILIPLITLWILKLTGLNEPLIKIFVTTIAMPAAANTVIFAKKFKGDALLASQLVFVSTLLSIVTIPLILILL